MAAEWKLLTHLHSRSRIAARSNRHGNCTTATVHTVVLRKFRAACVSKITVEITTSCHSLMKETDYNGRRFGCFTAGDVTCKRSIVA